MRQVITDKRDACRGMTLVELLLVMLILAIVMMAVMSMVVPMQRSTAVQTQVSDVQSNLRLALRTISRDLLLAGFLVPNNPVIFESSATPTTGENTTPKDFTIRTRIVGNDFARAIDVTASNLAAVKIGRADMADNFPDGTLIRLYEPVTATEINSGTVAEDQRVYRVESSTKTLTSTEDFATLEISTPYGSLNAADIVGETVIVRVPDNSQPALQTIRYRLINESLERIINGNVQILARNIDVANSGFLYDKTSEGRVNYVEITLTGRTKAVGNDAVSKEKSKAIKTSVKLRNIT